jgi:hypothetical protein
MHSLPTQCPICGDELQVTRLHCGGCGTALEGAFTPGRWQRINGDQLAFAEVFIKRRGKIKDVEDDLGISYPTVVARLNELITALGYEAYPASENGATAPQAPDLAAQRQAILDRLAAGEIDAGSAAQELRAL